MTLVQLEYVIALDTHRHFALAAKHCNVTQPTLSMQIHKLEQELNLKIFDRSKQPVIPTHLGQAIIVQARKIIAEYRTMNDIVQNQKGIFSGQLRVGIIPTLAPYLLPLFVQPFTKKYPDVRLTVNELTTELLIVKLKEGKIDVAILVTPLQEAGIKEQVLFYEELLVYVSKKNALYKKEYLLPKDIDPQKLWLMEEGHCFRSQIVNLCELRKASRENTLFEYEAGSIETLRRMVELNDGITIIPELATTEFSSIQQNLLRRFKAPAPMREVSLVVHRDFAKKRLVDLFRKEIVASIPDKVKKNKSLNIVPALAT